MSYEGYEEYLCEKGHYLAIDCYSETPSECPRCEAPIKWWHPVDQTNGYVEDNPGTYPAETDEVGYEDVWQEDHYGNRYATKIILHAPRGDSWRPFVPRRNDYV